MHVIRHRRHLARLVCATYTIGLAIVRAGRAYADPGGTTVAHLDDPLLSSAERPVVPYDDILDGPAG